MSATTYPSSSDNRISMLVAIFLTLGSFVLYGCGGSKSEGSQGHDDSESSEHAEMEMESGEHMEGMDADQDEGTEDHDHMDGMNDHMARMSEIREALQTSLGASYSDVIAPTTDDQFAQGKEVYFRVCAVCHGQEGKGDGVAGVALDPRPADFTDAEHASFYSDRARIEIIRKGSPGTAMAGWESTLSGDEIQAVFGYIRALRPSS